MTTNTYEALCDSVGAYEEFKTKDCIGVNSGNLDNCPTEWCFKCKQNTKFKTEQRPPVQSAEQRERLLKIIAKGTIEIYISTNNYCLMKYSCGGDNFSLDGYEFEAQLYVLTHKLVAEGVLSKEEVAKALKGGQDE